MSRATRRKLANAIDSALERLEPRTLFAGSLLRDINTIAPGSSQPTSLAEAGGFTYFAADDGISGREVWKTDGTAQGTYRVTEIAAGSASSSPGGFTAVNGTIFFAASDTSSGHELWKIDGSAAGAVRVKDVAAGAASSGPTNLVNVNGTLFFAATDAAAGHELWKSDGTAAGTVRVKDIVPGSDDGMPLFLANVNGTLYFGAAGSLWRSDGTTAGTVPVTAATSDSYIWAMTASASTIYFVEEWYDSNNSQVYYRLFKSDGTAAGTTLLHETIGTSMDHLTVSGGKVYYTVGGAELWVSDGTQAGTQSLYTLEGYPYYDSFVGVIDAAGTVFALANSYDQQAGRQLLIESSGTPGGTSVRAEFPVEFGPAPTDLVAIGNTVYFAAQSGQGGGAALWKMEAGASSVTFVADLGSIGTPGSSGGFALSWPTLLAASGNTLYYSYPHWQHGSELWKYTQATGPVLVRDITALTLPSVATTGPTVTLNGVTYFGANDGVRGPELWRTDGTTLGTTVVKEIRAGAVGGFSETAGLVAYNGAIYFAADDGTNGIELWRSDGTAAGTMMVKNIVAGFGGSSVSKLTVVGNTLYFTATDGSSGVELWKSDGTAAGTVRVADIAAGAASSSPANLTNVNGTLYFTASLAASGTELWKSDGSSGGTLLVKDINPGAASSSPAGLAALGATLVFTASDGTNGAEPWRSDGTAVGTSMLANINTGSAGSGITGFTGAGGNLFFSANAPGVGFELWKTDGTAGGTAMVKDIYAGAANSNPASLTNVNGALYFSANDNANGAELWKSDGTAAGTVLVKNIRTASNSSAPAGLTNVGGTLYFTADDGVTGRELWRSDGTAAGTVLEQDLRPGTLSSNPSRLTPAPGRLVFFADNGQTSHEPYNVNVGLAPTKDINTSPAGSGPSQAIKINGVTYFVASDSSTGAELWRTDGTVAGTYLVADIAPGAGASAIFNLVDANGTLYFTANNGTTGAELWKSDGTAAGTVMVKDIAPAGASSYPHSLTFLNGSLYFFAHDSSAGAELWKSNGTAAGTVRVKDIQPGPGGFGQAMVAVNNTLYFAYLGDQAGVSGLWKSDGTSAGTTLVSGFSDPVISMGKLGNKVLFATAPNNGYDQSVYASDGTAAGTVLLTNVSLGWDAADAVEFVEFNGAAYFATWADPGSYYLWRTDGTPGNTEVLRQFYNEGYQRPTAFTAVGNTLYFAAKDEQGSASGNELWKTDGTAAGTVLVKDITTGDSNPFNLTNFNGALYFTATDSAGVELWKSDGTAAGTERLKDIYAGAIGSNPGILVNHNGALFFSATDSTSGRELWKSDGTAAGTVLFKNLNPDTSGSGSNGAVPLNNVAYFYAGQDESAMALELWRSDGTAAGTYRVKDINPGAAGAFSSFSGTPVVYNGALYFAANNGTNGTELWKSDGTDAGTVLLKDIVAGVGSSSPFQLTVANGLLFFSASDSSGGQELWKSDGTAAGTVRVKDIWAGASGAAPANLANINGTLYFAANNGTSGAELWKSDGTDAGTVLVKDLAPGAASSTPSGFIGMNGSVYFKATDSATGSELYKTDGTAAGTVIVKDIYAGMSGSDPKGFAVVGSTLHFSAAGASGGTELWKSDGTAAGTVMVKDINPSGNSAPLSLVDHGGTLYFFASNGTSGLELWKSDGTAAGTVMLRDVQPGAAGGIANNLASLVSINGTLYFTANDGISGAELWQSDGTTAGTHLAAEIHPGAGSSAPTTLRGVGNRLFFFADDGNWGPEPWFYAPPLSPPPPVTQGLDVNGVTEANEETVGRYVPVNADHDENNADANGGALLDNQAPAAGHKIDPADNELVVATLNVTTVGTRWRLTFPDTVLVWREAAAGVWEPVVSGADSDPLAAAAQINLRIEGITASTSARDAEIRATFTPGSGAATEDVVKLTMVGVDVDVDSDRDDFYEMPKGDNDEDRIEGDAAKPGKIIYSAATTRVPLVLDFDGPTADVATAKFTIGYSSAGFDGTLGGKLKIWKSATATDAGSFLAPGEYTGAQLGLSGSARTVTLYMQGVAATTDNTNRLISVQMDPDGAAGGAGYIASDQVYVTVDSSATVPGQISGFKWWDQNLDGSPNPQIVKTPPNAIWVIDVSGSTKEEFRGANVGHVNDDGIQGSILDGELQAFINLNDWLQTQNFGEEMKIGVVVFGTTAKTLDLNGAAAGTMLPPGEALEAQLRLITSAYQDVGDKTNFEAGLQEATDLTRQMIASDSRFVNIYFLSDGFPFPDTSEARFRDEVITLTGPEFWGNANNSASSRVSLRAFGAGLGSQLEKLKRIDDRAERYTTSTPLLDAFAGVSQTIVSEPLLPGWTITAFIDSNENRVLDSGEWSKSAVTGPDGRYVIDGLAPGNYVVIETQQAGWTHTAPWEAYFDLTVAPGGNAVANFGNYMSNQPNLAIDSDNDNGFAPPDNSALENQLEDVQAKQTVLNDGDTNNNSKPDFVDFQSSGPFVPMIVDLSALYELDLNAQTTVRFSYLGSDPSKSNGNTPAAGFLRIWKKDAGTLRVVADYLKPDSDYKITDLGIDPNASAENLKATLYVEGIRTTKNVNEGLIIMDFDIDGAGPKWFKAQDHVFVNTDTPDIVMTAAPPDGLKEGDTVTINAILREPTQPAYTFEWFVMHDGEEYAFFDKTVAPPWDVMTDIISDATQSRISFPVLDQGTFDAKVLIKHNNVVVGQKTISVEVDNAPPEVRMVLHSETSIAPDENGEPPHAQAQVQPLDPNDARLDPGYWDHDRLVFTWTVTRNGAPYSVTLPDEPYVDFTVTEPGTYQFTCVVDDTDGGVITLTSEPFVRSPANSATVSGHVRFADFRASEEFHPGWKGFRVYYDADDDGAYDVGEAYDISAASSGSYTLKIPAGNDRRVRVDRPGHFVSQTFVHAPASGFYELDLSANGTESEKDFLLHPPLRFFTEPSLTYNWNPHQYQHNTINDTLWDEGDLIISGPKYTDTTERKIYLLRRSVMNKTNWELNDFIELGPDNLINGNSAFDAYGNLLVTNYLLKQVNKLLGDGETAVHNFLTLPGPEDIKLDKTGNIYVSTNSFFLPGGGTDLDKRRQGLLKFDKDGSLLGWLARGVRVDEFAIAPDQHTVVFSAGQADNRVWKLDSNTGEIAVLAEDYKGSAVQGVAVAGDDPDDPSSWKVIAGTEWLIVFDWNGKEIRRIHRTPDYNTWSPVYNDLELDLRSPLIWAGTDEGVIVQVNYETGEQSADLSPVRQYSVGYFDTGWPWLLNSVYGIAMYRPTSYSGQLGQQYVYDAKAGTDGIDTAPGDYLLRDAIPLRYKLVQKPGDKVPVGAEVDPLTGSVRWTPTEPGTYNFTLLAYEAHPWNSDEVPADSRAKVEQSWTVTVAPSGANDAPVIEPQTLAPGRVGNHYSGLVAASDADGDQLTYKLVGATPGVNIDPLSGLLTFAAGDIGLKTVVVSVEDGRGGYDQAEVSVNILPGIAIDNGDPTITGVNPTYAIAANQLLTIDTILLNDPNLQDRYTLSLHATSKPAGMLVSHEMTVTQNKGKITWRPRLSDTGKTYTVVLEADDGRGGITTATFTVTVTPGAPQVADVKVTDGNDPLRQRTLAARTYDAETVEQSEFVWTVTSKPSGAPAPTIIGYENNSSVDVTFFASGQYTFSVVAKWTPPGGGAQLTSTAITKTFEVKPDIQRLVPNFRSIVVPPSEDPHDPDFVDWLKVEYYDQFNRPVGALPAGWQQYWTEEHPFGASYQSGEGNVRYRVPTGAAAAAITIDVRDVTGKVRAMASFNIRTASSGYAGIIARGIRAVEGSETTFDGASGTDASLGAFIDTEIAVFDPTKYNVEIDWGDGTKSLGGLVPLTNTSLPQRLDPAIPQYIKDHYALITGTHRYGLQGYYSITVKITDTRSGDREPLILTHQVASETPDQLTVASAPLTMSPVAVAAINGQKFTGVIARFHDPAPVSDVSRFAARIKWGDGTESIPRNPNNEYQIRALGNGDYEVTATHTYFGKGRAPAKIGIYENFDGGPKNWFIHAIADLDIVVGSTDLSQPAKPTVTEVSPKVLQVRVAANPLTWGYRIKRYEYDASGATVVASTMLPPNDGQGNPMATVSNPYSDVGVKPNTWYAYQFIAVDEEFNESTPSPISDKFKTAPPLNVPAPVVTGGHVIVTDPQTNAREEGIQLYWTPPASVPPTSAPGQGWGYRIQRRTGTSGPFVDLFDTGRYIDVQDVAADGRLSYFDEFGTEAPFPAGVTSYTYRVYAIDAEGTPIAGASTDYVVAPDQEPPSDVTGLSAASYPQAIQLTWADRPVSDEDWAGWHVYRSDDGDSYERLTSDAVFEETGYNDVSAEDGQTYYYRVTSVDTLGNESPLVDAPQVVHKKSTNGEPPTPTGVAAVPQGANIRISWDPVNPIVEAGWEDQDSLKGYRVYRSTAPQFSIFGMTPVFEATRVDRQAALPPSDCTNAAGLNQTFYYAVTAIDFNLDESGPAYVVGKSGDGAGPGSPTGLEPTAATQTTITLQWTAPVPATNVAGYHVFRRLEADAGDPPNSYALVSGNNPLAALTWHDTGLTPGKTYEYRVYAVDAQGDFSLPASTAQSTDVAPDDRPLVVISSPVAPAGAGAALITKDQDVTGYVDDRNDDLHHWRLVLRPYDATDGTSDYILSAGDEEAGGEGQPVVLGKLKAALIPDGLYNLRLIAFDKSDGTEDPAFTRSSAAVPVHVKSEVKLGNFTFPSADLTISNTSGRSVTVRRVYDSARANEKGDFGYGWRLELNETDYSTTARLSISGRDSGARTLRFGDLVYVTIPGRGRHVFAFTPRPSNYDPITAADPMSWAYTGSAYAPQFVAVDGSNAILTVPRDGADTDPPNFLRYDAVSKEFIYEGTEGQLPYHPSLDALGNELQVLEPDGTRYFIDAATGQLRHSIDALGKRVDYGDDSTSGDIRLDIRRYSSGAKAGLVEEIRLLNEGGAQLGDTVKYDYDADGNLISFTSRDGQVLTYEYEDEVRPHHLTSVLDGRGVRQVAARYKAGTGELVSAVDPLGNPVNVSTGSFNGSSVRSTVTSATKQQAQIVHDQHGNVTREIEKVFVNGVLTKYIVTAHEYIYPSEPSIEDMLEYGVSDSNALVAIYDYDAVELPATATLKQVEEAKGRLARERTFYGLGNYGNLQLDRYVKNVIDPNLRQLHTETTWDAHGRPHTTNFEHYKFGKPQVITDAEGIKNYVKYDDKGRVQWTANALGEGVEHHYVPVSNVFGEGEFEGLELSGGNPGDLVARSFPIIVQNPQHAFDASDATQPTFHRMGAVHGEIDEWAVAVGDGSVYVTGFAGRVSNGDWCIIAGETYRIRSHQEGGADNSTISLTLETPVRVAVPAGAPVIVFRASQTNEFYDDSAPIGSRWKLKSTVGSNGVKTVFAYDAEGRQVVSARLSLKTSEAHEPSNEGKWVINQTRYDDAGRPVATYELVYLDKNYDGKLAWHLNPLAEGTEPHEASPVVIDEGVDHFDESIRLLSRTEYDVTGKVWKVTNEYGGETINHYDERGNLTERLGPDGSRTIQVYDIEGRVILSIDSHLPTQTEPVTATRSIYDEQGRVVETQRLSLPVTAIVVAHNGAADEKKRIYRVTQVTGAGLTRHVNPDFQSLPLNQQPAWWSTDSGFVGFSSNKSFYDFQGRVVESQNADGLRTGTAYAADGRVLFGGKLKDSAPVGAAGRANNAFVLADFDFYTESEIDRVNVDEIRIEGGVDVGDTFKVTFKNIGHTQQIVVQVTRAAGWTVDQFMSALAAQIETAMGAAVTAAAGPGGSQSVLLSWDQLPGFACYVEAADAAPGTVIYTVARNKSVISRDALGHWTATVSDVLGRPTMTIFHDNTFTRTLYATNGQVPGYEVDDDLISDAERDTYRIVKQTVQIDQQGVATSQLFDFAGRLVAVVQPDPDGNPSQGLGQAVWRYRYDANGNHVATIDPRDTDDRVYISSKQNVREFFEYDEFNRRTNHVRAMQGLGDKSWTYDAHGRIDTVSEPGVATRYTYNNTAAHGGRIEKEERKSGTFIVERTTYGYDSRGRRNSVTDDTFDPSQQINTGPVLVRGNIYQFDPITGGVTRAESTRTVNVYSSEGSVQSSTATTENVVHHKYDPATGRLKITWTGSSDNADDTGVAQVITRTDYDYDAFGRLKTVALKRRAGAGVAADNVSKYAYDHAGNLDAVETGHSASADPLFTRTDYIYDALNRLVGQNVDKVNAGGATEVLTPVARYDYNFEDTTKAPSDPARYRFKLEADGQRGGVIETRYNASGVPASTSRIDWTYDALNRLTGENYDGEGAANDYTDTYQLDEVGNRLKKEHNSDGDAAIEETTTYSYVGETHIKPEADRVYEEKVKNENGETIQTVTYQYNALGAVWEVSVDGAADSVRTYEFDKRGRVVKSTVDADGTNSTYQFEYDPSGRRVRQAKLLSVNGAQTVVEVQLKTIDAQNPTGYSQVLELRTAADEAGVATAIPETFVLGSDVLAQFLAGIGDGLSYYVYDGHGSVRGLVDGNGAADATQKFDYDAYGNAIAFSASAAHSRHLYVGEWWDTAVNGYDNRARVYDPAAGRFQSQDAYEGTTADPMSLHKYAYAHFNPVIGTDPSGHFTLVEQLKTAGLIGVGFGIGLAGWSGFAAYKSGKSVGYAIGYGFGGGMAMGYAIAAKDPKPLYAGIASALVGTFLLATADTVKNAGSLSGSAGTAGNALEKNRWKYYSYATEQFAWGAFNQAFMLPEKLFPNDKYAYQDKNGKWGPDPFKAMRYAAAVQAVSIVGGLAFDAMVQGTFIMPEDKIRLAVKDAVGNLMGAGMGLTVSTFAKLLDDTLPMTHFSPGLMGELAETTASAMGRSLEPTIGAFSNFIADVLISVYPGTRDVFPKEE